MMPELGFNPIDDNDRLVASYSGGWQMRMCLGKMLLKVGGAWAWAWMSVQGSLGGDPWAGQPPVFDAARPPLVALYQ